MKEGFKLCGPVKFDSISKDKWIPTIDEIKDIMFPEAYRDNRYKIWTNKGTILLSPGLLGYEFGAMLDFMEGRAKFHGSTWLEILYPRDGKDEFAYYIRRCDSD